MANYNQNSIPELPRRKGEVELEARQRFAAELQEAFTAAVGVLSRIPDAHYVPPLAEQARQPVQQTVAVEAQRQPQPTMADRLRQTVPFNPAAGEVGTPHLSDSQMSSARMGTHDPDHIKALVEQEAPDAVVLQQEQAKSDALEQVIAAYRTETGLPSRPVSVEASAPVEPAMTPLQRAEQVFPNDARYLVGDIDVSMADIRGAVDSAYVEPEPEEQQA